MELRVDDVLFGLETVRGRLSRILDDGYELVIEQAKATVNQYKQQGITGRWGFSIDPDRPLRFKVTEIDRLKLRVDLAMSAFWDSQPAQKPSELNVAIRIWCLTPGVYFREYFDASRLEDVIDSKISRVMLRLHFDLANQGQPGPEYHVQVGGIPGGSGESWFPEALSVPRLVHMPMDLVLAAELIAATFYPTEYKRLRREGTWKHSLRKSQEHLLPDYLDQAKKAIEGDSSVLEALWNVGWEQ